MDFEEQRVRDSEVIANAEEKDSREQKIKEPVHSFPFDCMH